MAPDTEQRLRALAAGINSSVPGKKPGQNHHFLKCHRRGHHSVLKQPAHPLL